MIDPISVILPEDAEADEHVYNGFTFVVHHHPLSADGLWVVTERTTGRTLTNAKRSQTKDHAKQCFIDAVDALDEETLLNGLMTALLETEEAPIMTLEEYIAEQER